MMPWVKPFLSVFECLSDMCIVWWAIVTCLSDVIYGEMYIRMVYYMVAYGYLSVRLMCCLVVYGKMYIRLVYYMVDYG